MRMPESRKNPKVGGAERREKGIRGRMAGDGQQRQQRQLRQRQPLAPSSLPLSLYWASADQRW